MSSLGAIILLSEDQPASFFFSIPKGFFWDVFIAAATVLNAARELSSRLGLGKTKTKKKPKHPLPPRVPVELKHKLKCFVHLLFSLPPA